MEKHDSAVTPESCGFAFEPVTPENFAETVRRQCADMMQVSADKISVTVTDGEILIVYDAGMVETAEMEMGL